MQPPAPWRLAARGRGRPAVPYPPSKLRPVQRGLAPERAVRLLCALCLLCRQRRRSGGWCKTRRRRARWRRQVGSVCISVCQRERVCVWARPRESAQVCYCRLFVLGWNQCHWTPARQPLPCCTAFLGKGPMCGLLGDLPLPQPTLTQPNKPPSKPQPHLQGRGGRMTTLMTQWTRRTTSHHLTSGAPASRRGAAAESPRRDVVTG